MRRAVKIDSRSRWRNRKRPCLIEFINISLTVLINSLAFAFADSESRLVSVCRWSLCYVLSPLSFELVLSWTIEKLEVVGEFQTEVPSILLNRILLMFLGSRVGVLLIEQVVRAK